ncbi:MAG TPA: OmpA family protein [Acetobacteraceae bacterium]|nr:OmpA family protein [Acetobacteraceae bacterium]
MDAAPPSVAELAPVQPPAPPAHTAPPPAPPIRNDAATKVAATSGLRVSFPPGKAELSPDSAAAIKHLVGSTQGNGAVTFTVAAYATGVADDPSVARRLSLSRALAVRTALLAAGVSASRIEVRAMGSNVHSGPLDRADVSVLGANDPAR